MTGLGSKRRLLILKTGSTLPEIAERRGDFEQWFAAGLGIPLSELDVVSMHEGEPAPPAHRPAGIVVTGSPAMVSDREPWSETAASWLAEAANHGTPILGVCYGHQLLAHGLGGRVGPNPAGRQIGTHEFKLSDAGRLDPLFARLFADLDADDVAMADSESSLDVQASHVESVLELPPGARLLGSTGLDPHHAFAIGSNVWGIQFHPEFDGDIVRGYLEGRREAVASEGLDVDSLIARARDSIVGTAVLRRFAAIVGGGPGSEHAR